MIPASCSGSLCVAAESKHFVRLWTCAVQDATDRSMFYEICASYDNFDHIYTDGSKMGDRVASAAICSNMVRSTRLPNNASIFRAELYTITLAMYFSVSYLTVNCRLFPTSSFVLKNGRISGIVARAINFTLSTQLWILLDTVKFAVAVRRDY